MQVQIYVFRWVIYSAENKTEPSTDQTATHGERAYTIYRGASNWYHAREICEEKGDRLAVIHGNAPLIKKMASLPDVPTSAWIGLRRTEYVLPDNGDGELCSIPCPLSIANLRVQALV